VKIKFKQYIKEAHLNIDLPESLDDILKSIVRPDRAKGEKLVWVDVDKFDKNWSNDKGFYIGIMGTGQIHNRYKDFIEFLKMPKEDRKRLASWESKKGEIAAAEVFVDEIGRVSFTNGRHRFSVFRDLGAKKIPVSMSSKAVKNAQKFGYI
jgi:hypothetical protein